MLASLQETLAVRSSQKDMVIIIGSDHPVLDQENRQELETSLIDDRH
jgi:glycosyltransferase A (GT-A) superfamily protein (DUF2064 family)